MLMHLRIRPLASRTPAGLWNQFVTHLRNKVLSWVLTPETCSCPVQAQYSVLNASRYRRLKIGCLHLRRWCPVLISNISETVYKSPWIPCNALPESHQTHSIEDCALTSPKTMSCLNFKHPRKYDIWLRNPTVGIRTQFVLPEPVFQLEYLFALLSFLFIDCACIVLYSLATYCQNRSENPSLKTVRLHHRKWCPVLISNISETIYKNPWIACNVLPESLRKPSIEDCLLTSPKMMSCLTFKYLQNDLQKPLNRLQRTALSLWKPSTEHHVFTSPKRMSCLNLK